jgi:hypothetical protein
VFDGLSIVAQSSKVLSCVLIISSASIHATALAFLRGKADCVWGELVSCYPFGLPLVVFVAIFASAQTHEGLGVPPDSTQQYCVNVVISDVAVSFPSQSKAGKIPFVSSLMGTSPEWPVESGNTWTTSFANVLSCADLTLALTMQHWSPQLCEGCTIVTFRVPQLIDLAGAQQKTHSASSSRSLAVFTPFQPICERHQPGDE